MPRYSKKAKPNNNSISCDLEPSSSVASPNFIYEKKSGLNPPSVVIKIDYKFFYKKVLSITLLNKLM